MGGAVSSFSDNQTEAERAKILLNVVLRDMFQRADMVDLYSLADPSRCSKYIVVGASAIEQLFSKLNLEPRMGKRGEIYFQKMETIAKANPMGEQRDKICKYLSFFFIRIFQIYGALSLSIIDSVLPPTDPEPQIRDTTRDRRGVVTLGVPQLRGFEQRPATWFGGALTEGPLQIPGALLVPGQVYGSGSYYLDENLAGPYKILNLFLLVPADRNPNSAAAMRFQDFNMEIEQGDLYDFPAGQPRSARTTKNFTAAATPKPTVMYSFRVGEVNRIISAAVDLVRDGDSIDIRLRSINLVARRAGLPAVNANYSQRGRLNNRRPGDDNPVSSSGKQLPAYLQELFTRAFEEIEPPLFFPIEFLEKFKIISSIDVRQAKIEGTKVVIQDPRALRRSAIIPIVYSGKYGNTDIQILLQLTVTKADERGGRRKYTVSIPFEGMETRPATLDERLNKTGVDGTPTTRRSREFFIDEPTPEKAVPLSERGETINAFISSVFERLLKTTGDLSSRNISYDKQGRPVPYDSAQIPDEYKVKALWTALAKDPPIKSHCIARAVQLLNVAAIRDPTTGNPYSSVCRVKFPYIKDGSLPELGKSITTSEGIKAMAMLFVDRLVGVDQVPRLANTPEFTNFRIRMNRVFGKRAPGAPDANVDDGKVENIIDVAYPFCSGHDADRLRLQPGSPIVRSLQQKAQQLINRQLSHIGRVMQIMFRLFDEKSVRAGSVKMSNEVLTGGMEAVNRIGEAARNLLIQNYSDCETLFAEGLYELNRSLPNPIPADRFERVDALG
jgi:hypothetical protein